MFRIFVPVEPVANTLLPFLTNKLDQTGKTDQTVPQSDLGSHFLSYLKDRLDLHQSTKTYNAEAMKNHLKILSSQIVKFSLMSEPRTNPSPELLQVKVISCYLRENISFTRNMTLETGASLRIDVNLF